MKIYVKASAMKKKDLADDLQDVTIPIIQHLLKLYLFPNAEEKMHWRREVAKLLRGVPKLKAKHKRPSANFIFENTYLMFSYRIKEFVDDVIADEYTLTPDNYKFQNIDWAVNIIEEYFDWLSNQLSTYGVITLPTIYSKLEELGL